MDNILDIFGQQPFFTMNTQICFAYLLHNASSSLQLIDTLNTGLKTLYSLFPWLACEVVNEGSQVGSSGTYKFRRLVDPPRVAVRDFTEDTSSPTMEQLVQANFPISLLHEDSIAPRKTFANFTSTQSGPVFLVQANLINGGLLLTFLAQHNTMDMTGQANIIRLLDKVCRNEELTTAELESGNLSRHRIVPLLGDTYEPGPEIQRWIGDSQLEPQSDIAVPDPSKSVSAYFEFSRSALAKLKALASEAISPPAFVSTDDALSAYLWQSICRARTPRFCARKHLVHSTHIRAVDARPYLGISPLYPGPIQSNAYTTSRLNALAEQPLGNIALQLRQAVDPHASNLKFETQAFATLLHRTPDKTRVSPGKDSDLSVDLILSSWVKMGGYDVDFGICQGKPVSIRRPGFDAAEGLVFLMPRTPDGDIAVAVSLRSDDMARLREDSSFGIYATHLG
ncbi:trichothecene 3-O-acetyltransferase [Microdochium nivale]|nr:trichothecene 3-O-acetyltransferase [Microdochium nivale]